MERKRSLFVAILFAQVCAAAPAQTSPATEPAPPDLLAGEKWEISTDGGKTFSEPVAAPLPTKAFSEPNLAVVVRITFEANAPIDRWPVLELAHNITAKHKPAFTLNDKPLAGPLKGMFYRTIVTTGPNRVLPGTNTLTAAIQLPPATPPKSMPADSDPNAIHSAQESAKPEPVDFGMTLRVLRPTDLRIRTGPILGASNGSSFAVVFRTNMPAVDCCRVDMIDESNQLRGGPVSSLLGDRTLHRMSFDRLHLVGDMGLANPPGKLAKELQYRISALVRGGCVEQQFRIRLLDPNCDSLRFVACGDSRTDPNAWGRVAAAVLKERPDLVVFGGDTVGSGFDDWQWDHEFWEPAKGLLATVPFYYVVGNHESAAPLADQLFWTPTPDGLGRNWAQRIGPILLIGVDGQRDWSAKDANLPGAAWLEKQLADGNDAKFIFLANHYPAWSGAKHGALNKEGVPSERSTRQAQEIIMPLLAKYRATAYLAGHDHDYERSEPPDGVTHIVTGGAGAPLYAKAKDADKQNPHSKVFASKHHYCLFEVKGGECTMVVRTPEGEQIDSRTWKARN